MTALDDAVDAPALALVLARDDDAGVLDALRVGVGAVRLAARHDVAARVADIAAQLGARVEPGPAPDGALDLAEARDPYIAAQRFIAAAER